MEIVLYVVFFVSCLMLVATVLLQPGKTDAGALFTSGVSSAALNPRGTQSVLSKITITAATIFMLSALLLSLPAITGDRSVLDTQGTESKDAANANTNANANANANANTNANTPSNTAPVVNANAANTSEPAKKEDSTVKETKVEKKADAKPADEKKEEKK